MEGSTAAEGPPQAKAESVISALLQQPSAYRREVQIRIAILGGSNRRWTARIRNQRTTPSPGVRAAARLGRFRSGLRWPTHALLALRAAEGESVIGPSVTLS